MMLQGRLVRPEAHDSRASRDRGKLDQAGRGAMGIAAGFVALAFSNRL